MKMKNIFQQQIITLAIASIIIVITASCASHTQITTSPAGARVYADDVYIGETPVGYSDTKIAGSRTHLKIEKDGFESVITSVYRGEKIETGILIGGIIGLPLLLWSGGYQPVQSYELKPEKVMLPAISKEPLRQSSATQQQTVTNSQSKYDALRKLSELLKEQIITQEEFDREKKKILEN